MVSLLPNCIFSTFVTLQEDQSVSNYLIFPNCFPDCFREFGTGPTKMVFNNGTNNIYILFRSVRQRREPKHFKEYLQHASAEGSSNFLKKYSKITNKCYDQRNPKRDFLRNFLLNKSVGVLIRNHISTPFYT